MLDHASSRGERRGARCDPRHVSIGRVFFSYRNLSAPAPTKMPRHLSLLSRRDSRFRDAGGGWWRVPSAQSRPLLYAANTQHHLDFQGTMPPTHPARGLSPSRPRSDGSVSLAPRSVSDLFRAVRATAVSHSCVSDRGLLRAPAPFLLTSLSRRFARAFRTRVASCSTRTSDFSRARGPRDTRSSGFIDRA